MQSVWTAGIFRPVVTPYSRKNPFPARVAKMRPLTRSGSGKETLHFELSLSGSGLRYEAGDSLGIFPSNDPADVDELLVAVRLDGATTVESPSGKSSTLRDVLMRDVTLREPSRQLLAHILSKWPAASEDLSELLDPEAQRVMDEWIDGREVIDILLAYPQAGFTAHELVKTLRKLQPRLYSIASSPKAYPEEIHLTIAVVRYETHGRKRHGLCTTFLADRADGESVPVFIHSAKHFRPPEDLSASLIMVGPGTGIAPFRAFLQDREASGAKGKTWLFFGERNRATDFFYEDEFNRWLGSGILTRLDTAFSRDQGHKIYVQDRMLESGADLWAWLQNGAYFYVCGDAARMAKDVDAALHRIAREHGGKSEADADAYVEELKKSKRYRKDVY